MFLKLPFYPFIIRISIQMKKDTFVLTRTDGMMYGPSKRLNITC